MAKTWGKLEHHIFSVFKKYDLSQRENIIIAISGGVDSVVLAYALLKTFPQKKIHFWHYHHGRDGQQTSHAQSLFRDQCVEFLKTWVSELQSQYQINLVIKKSSSYLSTEHEAREARMQFFSSQLQQFDSESFVFCTAHQKEDLLETRLLKLIRGTGVESLMAFSEWNTQKLRPLLDVSKKEILEYAKHNNLKWIEDPTNTESDYMRNWLRNAWLPALENKKTGSVHQFSLSLDRLITEVVMLKNQLHLNTQEFNMIDLSSLLETEFASENRAILRVKIDRMGYIALSEAHKVQLLAQAFRLLPKAHVSLGQIKEMIKRLDKNQKDLSFSLSHYNCFTNAEQIMVEYKNII